MAGIPRSTQVIFGSTGLVGTGGFGAAAAGTVTTEVATSQTLAAIMATAAWPAGWANATLGSSKFPAIEDMNALAYTLSTQIAYLLERGIPEYDAGTTYNANDIAKKTGTYQLYGSKTNANLGNALTSTANWQYLGDLSVLASFGAPDYWCGTSTGSANAQVLTTGQSLSALVAGETFGFTAGFTNTGDTTVAIDSVAATHVYIDTPTGLALLSGNEIITGDDYQLLWDGSKLVLSNLNKLINSLPSQSITGANHTFASSDSGAFTNRSNSGTAMSDSLPTGGSALANGSFGYYKNTDATATITISGGTINQGNLTGNVIILPGELWLWQSQGSAVYNWQRVASATLHTSPVQGASKNLAGAYASTTTCSYTADEIVLSDTNNNTRKISTFSQTMTITASGAGGLDTGARAINTWYYIWAIYNPTTNTQSILASLSSSAPTMPSGYTFKAIIGVVRTDGSSNIIGFQQVGKNYQWKVGSNLSAARVITSGASGSPSTPTWTSVSISNFVPTAIANYIQLYLSSASGSQSSGAAPNNSYGTNTSSTNAPPMLTTVSSACNCVGGFVLESTNIFYYSGGTEPTLYALGFIINV